MEDSKTKTEAVKIGVFGCSADPFTLAHREIVKRALAEKLVDKVIIVPTIVSYYREDKVPWLSSAGKLETISALVKGIDGVEVDSTELRRRDTAAKLSLELQEHAVKSWRFIDTLLRLKLELGSDVKLCPIIGGDSFEHFKTWFAWRDIIKESGCLIAVERAGVNIDAEAAAAETPELAGKLKVLKLGAEFAEISASALRETWKTSLPSEYLKWALSELKKSEEAEAESLLLHTPIFDVVRGTETDTGLKPVLVDAPDWVSIIVRGGSKNVLTVKQVRYGSACEIEEFPCGMVEKGEAPQEAAIRELAEETGIQLKAREDGSFRGLEYLGATNPNPAFMTNRMHYFFLDLGEAEFEKTEQRLDEHERITCDWTSAAELLGRSMELAASGEGKVPAILLSAFALLRAAGHDLETLGAGEALGG